MLPALTEMTVLAFVPLNNPRLELLGGAQITEMSSRKRTYGPMWDFILNGTLPPSLEGKSHPITDLFIALGQTRRGIIPGGSDQTRLRGRKRLRSLLPLESPGSPEEGSDTFFPTPPADEDEDEEDDTTDEDARAYPIPSAYISAPSSSSSSSS